MDIKSYIPIVPDWPQPGVNFLDITGILTRPQVFNHVINLMSLQVQQLAPTSVVAIESRGFVFASPIAKALGLPLILVRKPTKLPGAIYTTTYQTEYSTDSVSIKQDSPVGERPCIVDDLIATGGTVLATAKLLREHFEPQAITCVAVIGLDFLLGHSALELAGIRTHTVVDYA